MSLMFAGQTNGPNWGWGSEAQAPPWPPSRLASRPEWAGSTQQCWFLEFRSNSRDISVFVLPFVHVARLFTAVTFGLVED